MVDAEESGDWPAAKHARLALSRRPSRQEAASGDTGLVGRGKRCLGRALAKTGRRWEASRHAALAAGMRPDRADYVELRDKLRSEAA